jgi:hypothetical protein
MKPTPLTDEEIKEIIPDGDDWKHEVGFTEATKFARAIEAAVNAKWEALQEKPVEKRFPVGGADYGWQGEYNRGWNDCINTMKKTK